ncbi:ribosome maturation factor RimM [Bacteroidia bacterium]|nr:ribosome maturation factor RimM [Bacteroidia bacterium]
MIRREDLVKIGKFGKPHGVFGEISISPPPPLNGTSFLVCEIDNIFVPFRVIESRIISDTTAYVQLKNLNSNEAVRVLVNKDVYFDKHTLAIGDLTRNPLTENPNAVSWDYFLGYTLIDKNAGEIGVVSGIDDSTPNTLFIVDDEILIPANADFVASIDEKRKQIQLELPEGLLEI